MRIQVSFARLHSSKIHRTPVMMLPVDLGKNHDREYMQGTNVRLPRVLRKKNGFGLRYCQAELGSKTGSSGGGSASSHFGSVVPAVFILAALAFLFIAWSNAGKKHGL